MRPAQSLLVLTALLITVACLASSARAQVAPGYSGGSITVSLPSPTDGNPPAGSTWSRLGLADLAARFRWFRVLPAPGIQPASQGTLPRRSSLIRCSPVGAK